MENQTEKKMANDMETGIIGESIGFWCYIGVILGLHLGYIGVILGLYWDYIGIMEDKMKITIFGLGLGFRVEGLGFQGLGFRVWGFRGLEFRVQGLGFLGFRGVGLGFQGFRVAGLGVWRLGVWG